MTGSETSRRADIQGIRALAVVLVVLFHAGLAVPGGFIGVDVFFVVSGFVITSLIVRGLGSEGGFAPRAFYTRRVRRLLPPLALASIVTLAGSILLLSPTGSQQEGARTATWASLMAGNVYLYRFGRPYFNASEENPFLHTWSLGVEEQTYLVLPVLLAVAWWVGRRWWTPRRATVAVLGLLGLGSFVLGVLTSFDTGALPVPLPLRFAFYLPFTRLWEFAAGAALAVVVQRGFELRSSWQAPVGWMGLALVVAGGFAIDSSMEFPGVVALVPVLGTVALITAGENAVGLLSTRPMVWIGDVSYEWYLWHWPAIVFVAFTWPDASWALLVAAALSLPLAALARRVVGDRFRYNDAISGRRVVALMGACALVPVALATGVQAGADRGWGVESLQELADAQERSRMEAADCDSLQRNAGCIFGDEDRPLVALVGDSHGSAVSDVVWEATEGRSATFAAWTRPACPFRLGGSTSDRRECESWVRSTAAWLGDIRPDVVIVHFRSGYPNAEETADTAAGVREAVELTGSPDTRFIWLEDVPRFESDLAATVLDPTPTLADREVDEVLADASPLRSAAGAALAGTATYVTTAEAICGDTMCSQRDGVWLYRDTDHVTYTGADRLRPALDDALAAALD